MKKTLASSVLHQVTVIISHSRIKSARFWDSLYQRKPLCILIQRTIRNKNRN